jgi:biopolymer transport protein ExbD
MKITYKLIILSIIIVACQQAKIDLPKSKYYVNLPKPGIDRNIFLNFKNRHLYHNDSLINDLDHFYDNLSDFVKMNDGSNRYRIVLSASNNTNFKLIDSIFYLLAKKGFSRCFVLTNYPIDSIGFQIPTFIGVFPDLWGRVPNDSTKKSRDSKKMISKDGKKIYINDSILTSERLLSECNKIINLDQYYCLQMRENNTYGEFVYLLDCYLLAYEKLVNEYCISHYNKTYDSLRFNDKDVVDIKFKKKWNFKYLKNSVHNML